MIPVVFALAYQDDVVNFVAAEGAIYADGESAEEGIYAQAFIIASAKNWPSDGLIGLREAMKDAYSWWLAGSYEANAITEAAGLYLGKLGETSYPGSEQLASALGQVVTQEQKDLGKSGVGLDIIDAAIMTGSQITSVAKSPWTWIGVALAAGAVGYLAWKS